MYYCDWYQQLDDGFRKGVSELDSKAGTSGGELIEKVRFCVGVGQGTQGEMEALKVRNSREADHF